MIDPMEQVAECSCGAPDCDHPAFSLRDVIAQCWENTVTDE